MKIIIKPIPGGVIFKLEVSTDSTVIYVKELVEKKIQRPVNQQKLLFKGKRLIDEMTLKDYNISDGNTIHLLPIGSLDSGSQQSAQKVNEEDLNRFWDQLSDVLKNYYSNGDTTKIINEFKRNLMADIEDMSLDDIERLATFKLNQQ